MRNQRLLSIPYTNFNHIRCVISVLIFTLFLFGSSVKAQNAVSSLKPGEKLTRTINAKESERYNISLNANDFIIVNVEQRGIDITVSLFTPDGKLSLKVDSPNGTRGSESLKYIAASKGVYILEIKALRSEASGSEYAIELKTLRTATTDDEQIFSIVKLIREAEIFEADGELETDKKAIESYEKALLLLNERGNLQEQIGVLLNVSLLYILLGDYETSLKRGLSGLEFARKFGDVYAETTILDRVARCYYELDEPQRAIEFHAKAAELNRKLNRQIALTNSLNGLCVSYAKLGDLRKAVDFCQQTIEIYRAANVRNEEGIVLYNIGSIYNRFGEPLKAVEFYNKALETYRIKPNPGYESAAYSALGRLSATLGESDKAFDYYNKALDLARKTGERSSEALTLNNIGATYNELGETQTAIEFYEKALTIFRAIKKPSSIATTLNNIGSSLRETGEIEKALQNFNESVRLAHETDDKLTEANALYNIGKTLFVTKKPREALDYFNRALEINRAINNPAKISAALTGIANCHADLNETKIARENYEKAFDLIQNYADKRREAETLFYFARFENNQNNFESALVKIESAIEIVENLRNKITLETLRSSYLASVADYYELRTNVLMNLDAKLPNENSGESYAARALESNEKAHARSFLELLNESNANIKQGVDEKSLAREKELRQLLSAKAIRQTSLLQSKSTPEQKTGIANEINELNRNYESLQSEIRRTSPRYAALVQPKTLSVKQIQSEILDPNTVILEYALGEKQSYLWLVKQNSLKSYKLPARENIENLARRVYKSLSVRDFLNNAKTRADNLEIIELSRILLAPVADEIQNKRLLIVADGALQYVPFSALTIKAKTPKMPRRFLVESNEIVVLPSIATVSALRRETKTANDENKSNSIALIADPIFSKNDARIAQLKKLKVDDKLTAVNDLELKSLERSARESGFNNFLRLRFSRIEAENIASLAESVENGKVLKALDFAATKQILNTPGFNESKIIHFATHGIINSKNPELSGIVLSLVDENGDAQDGFLRLYDIYNLSLKSDLVVLSACQTALGKQIKGEGLIGLTRGFMYAGTPRVVSSLWSIDDRATAELMQKFYRKMLIEKMRPATALRMAQIEMSKLKQYQSPFYWAAFTLQGEWR